MGQGSSSGFSIDLASLRFFADTLSSESQAGLQPGVERARREALTSVPFGQRSASGEVVAGVKAVDAALSRAWENTGAQVKAAEILIAAAHRILTTYANVDLDAGQQLAVVEWTLSEAVRTSQTIYQTKPVQGGMLP